MILDERFAYASQEALEEVWSPGGTLSAGGLTITLAPGPAPFGVTLNRTIASFAAAEQIFVWARCRGEGTAQLFIQCLWGMDGEFSEETEIVGPAWRTFSFPFPEVPDDGAQFFVGASRLDATAGTLTISRVVISSEPFPPPGLQRTGQFALRGRVARWGALSRTGVFS